MFCPKCQQPLDTATGLCPRCNAFQSVSMGSGFQETDNPYAPPQSSSGYPGGFQGDYSGRNFTQYDLMSLVLARKFLVISIVLMAVALLASIALLVTTMVMAQTLGANQPIPEEVFEKNPVFFIMTMIAGFTYIAYFFCAVFAFIPTIWTAVKAKISVPMLVLVILGHCFCCINLLPMILVNVAAAGILRQHGAKVGWFGAQFDGAGNTGHNQF